MTRRNDPSRSLRPLVPATLAALGFLAASATWVLLRQGLQAALPWLSGTGLMLVVAVFQARQLRIARSAVARLVAEFARRERAAQHAGCPVVVTDNELRVLWCNHAFVRASGYSLEDLQGKPIGPRLHSPNVDPVARERLLDAVRGHADADLEILLRFRDRQDRWVRLQLAPQRDGQNQPAGFVAMFIDIDAQVRTREVLSQTLRYTRSLMRLPDEYLIVAETDAQGRITRANRRFQEASGYSEQELLGRSLNLVGSGLHNAAFWREMWERISSGLPWQGEVCNRGRHGRLYWVQSLIAPVSGADGSIERYVSFQIDISAHRLAQMELSQNESLLRRTGQLAGVGGWTAALDSGALHMTPECRQLLGVQDGEITTYQELWRCFAQGIRLVIRGQLQELVQGAREEVNLLASVRPLAGSPARWVRLVASLRGGAIESAGVRTERIIGAVQDYTPQILAQERIREEQRILHSAMDAVGEAFALYDAQGTLVYCNDAYRGLLPQDHARLQGVQHQTVLEWMSKGGMFREAVGREALWVKEQLDGPVAGMPDRVVQTADGRWLRCIDRVTVDGHRVVLRNDVSELQEALLRADAAVVSKGQFLANMSHEIRTPINAVMGLLELLRGTSLSHDQVDMVGKSLTAARSLLDIINDILDFSKIEAGKLELHPVPFRLSDLQHELDVVLTGARGSKPLALVFDADADLPDVLVGDPVRIKQVLFNLGGNAVKFTEWGEVRLSWRLLSREDCVLRVRFEVSDTGIGIAPEQQSRIFHSFSQAEASTTRRFGGSGLGLTISQRLVEKMGGSIGLQSVLGQGSTFGFDIDLQVGDPADLAIPLPLAQGSGPRLQGLRLLLAEDNPLNQEVALAVLRREGAHVTLAENGQEAVDALSEAPDAFDAVLMDMQMPVLDGLQATERIREGLGLRELPVLAMTANAMQQDRDRCLRAGMNAHIGKPFEVEHVVALLQHFTRPVRTVQSPDSPLLPPATEAGGPVEERPLREDTDALRRLGGDAALLGQLRLRFPANAEDILRGARQCAERLDSQGAADALHQLKGAAAVVGAARLAGLSARQERHARDDGSAASMGELMRELVALESVLAETLAVMPVAVSGVALPEAGRAPLPIAVQTDVSTAPRHACVDDLGKLKALLEVADMAAIDAHEAWLGRHAVARDPCFESLNAAMDVLDFPAALAACEALAQPTSP